MIKEIFLSLAIAAFSGVSSFVGSPKNAKQDVAEYWGDYSFTMTPSAQGFVYFDVGYDTPVLGPNQTQIEIGSWHLVDNNTKLGVTVQFSDDGTANYYRVEMGVEFFCGTSYRSDIYALLNTATITEGWGKTNYDSANGVQSVFTGYISKENGHESEFQFSLKPIFNLERNYINCDIASSPVLPSTYSNELAPMKPTYYVTMVSNAGGYGFTSESVTQTGGIVIRNFNLIDEYNNSGYYATCTFTAELPYNDCSITIQAFLPTYTITTNLERCTVSPAIPSSYIGTSFIGDYTFTAVNGYGFNKNYTHWEVTNLFIDRVEFSNLLWGSFYSSVTLRLRASGGNSSISVTAIEYDEENYKLGYDEGRADGWQAGYDKGHADGEIAGNSYGVWNWLKQAAITTGEFLSINLLPGFSIGGLLTALAGLMIIWLFIKGFLFKS